MVVAILGPGTVIGTEMLKEGVVSNYTIKTTADCLLWILTREDYLKYLKLDPQQVQSAKEYDQMMYYWVNTNQLPIAPSQDSVIDILRLLFESSVYEADSIVWEPAKQGKTYRILLSGKAVVGGEKRKELVPLVELNEFDLDIGGRIPSFNSR